MHRFSDTCWVGVSPQLVGTNLPLPSWFPGISVQGKLGEELIRRVRGVGSYLSEDTLKLLVGPHVRQEEPGSLCSFG